MTHRNVLVVAHPDDEVLWFSSLLADIDLVILVYRDYPPKQHLGSARLATVRSLPYDITFLELPEPGSYNLANWHAPQPSEFGLCLPCAEPDEAGRYAQNFDKLVSNLPHLLHSTDRVYTHNPWGEYGHEDHVQIYRAVQSVGLTLKFEIYVDGYVSAKSAGLMTHYGMRRIDRIMVRPVNRSFSNNLARIYLAHNAWTWATDWVFPRQEYFLPHEDLTLKQGSNIPVKHLIRLPATTGNRQAGY